MISKILKRFEEKFDYRCNVFDVKRFIRQEITKMLEELEMEEQFDINVGLRNEFVKDGYLRATMKFNKKIEKMKG